MAKSSIRKAVVLAAGLGTRLRPFTCVTPKPLMPVWGETMLDRIVAQLRAHGVDDIVVNAHHLSDQIAEWCAANGCRTSYEPEILGSGGVLNPLRGWIGNDPFYLVSSDIVMENVPDIEKPFAKLPAEALGCCLVCEQGPRTIEVEPESRLVTCWKSPDSGLDGTFTYCGLALLKPEILAYVKSDGFSSIVEAYEKAMMEGRFVEAVRSDDLLWEDAGTIQRYIDLNRDGDDNSFADFPQLKALGVTRPSFLGARGSERVFFGCDEGVAVLYDDANRTENAKYAGHARWLKAKGISVPEVLRDLPEMKALLLENAGAERKMSLDEYAKVVGELVKFNALGTAEDLPDLMPAFDAALWKWERDLFAEHCLGTTFGLEMSAAVRTELEGVAARLAKEPPALVHRDFQSTNVLWKNDRLFFIDFQGMRLGPAAYDLASLVYDPYVTMSDERRRALVALYAKESGRPEIADVLPFAAVQRLVQCLGAYGRLASVGQVGFAKYVEPALVNLLDAADRSGLDAVGALAEDLIARVRRSHGHGCGEKCSCGHAHHS